MILATRNTGKNVGFSKTVRSTVAGDIVTLSEAKNFMRVTTSDDDTLIGTIIDAIIDHAELYTGLTLRQKEYTFEYQQYGQEIILPYGPHVSVDEVRTKYQGEETVVGTGDYWVTGQQFFTLNLVEFYTHQELEIDVTAGYGASNVPPAIKLAILKAVLSHYEDRQDNVGGTIVATLPNESKSLLKQFKRVFF